MQAPGQAGHPKQGPKVQAKQMDEGQVTGIWTGASTPPACGQPSLPVDVASAQPSRPPHVAQTAGQEQAPQVRILQLQAMLAAFCAPDVGR